MSIIKLHGLNVHLGEPWQVAENVGHGWFPYLAQFPTGELLLTYSLASDSNENSFDVSGFQLSTDGGKHWSMRYDMLPEHQPMIYIQQADGALFALPAHLYADAPDDAHNFYAGALRFEAGGCRMVYEPQGVRLVDWPWTAKHMANPCRPDAMRVNLCFDGSALQIGEELLATLYGTAAGDEFYQVVVASSADGGRTWRYLATVAGPEIVPTTEPRGHGPAEPSLVRLANGELMCVMRMGGGAAFPLRRSYSRDDGRTWSTPDIISPYSVEPSMKRLHNDVIALSTGRPGVFLWLSADVRGEKWQSIDLLAHHNQWATDAYQIRTDQTTAYTELIEIAPNRLLIAYDRTPFGWKPALSETGERNRIFLLPVEIERT